MMHFAHSPDKLRGIPAQDYTTHVNGVFNRASEAADKAAHYATFDGELLKHVVYLAAEFHDLGKLDEQNQDVLSGKAKAKKLPVQHTDAGTAYLLDSLEVTPGAVLIRSHHIGLPDFIDEQNRSEESILRDDSVREKVNQALPELIRLHKEALQRSQIVREDNWAIAGTTSLFFRIALSCLADGDHSDTAIHYGDQTADEPIIELRPTKRLAALDKYVEELKEDNDRSRQRSEIYETCRNAVTETGIVSCDSPVGTGKTTAIMAHLLSRAEKQHFRRIIIVLPFTNIIRQSVEIYRKALVLPDENPELVVAELHHRADFQDVKSRQFTALWKAPIIVTTAVTFFETLASNTPAALRRLHALPGSAVFVDESHAALPAKLLPLAWDWIKAFAYEWGCYWVMASGSLNRYWKIKEFDEETPDVPEIIPNAFRERLAKYEEKRITYKFQDIPFGPEDLVGWLATLPGPRIVILNTVQSAAVVAREYEKRFQRFSVEHLSTSLTPLDRDKTLKRIRSRLTDKNDTDWTLIATSCVEAGVDLSFRTGVRESASLVSLLQTGGRVNRHIFLSAETVWTILIKEEGLLKRHPGMSDSSKVLVDLISEGRVISPSLCTDALKREIRLAGNFSTDLLKKDREMRFPQVEKDFQVIASDTRTVVVGNEIIDKLERHLPVDWRDIQNSSVQIWGYRLDVLQIPEVLGHHGIYKWIYAYDNFIGYMAGILPVEAIQKGIGGACII
ncbi:MAG: CRISPR-associated endonuclease Cas3'' [Deltaproteobacteria bacterium]|nr:CRISPR-associated endonuclease Cas3'' [Deltaproteobacteria bacterium]